MSEFIIAALGLAFTGLFGFCVGRQSLWDRLEAAEAKATEAEADAQLIKVGCAVMEDVKSCIRMTACIGEAYSYQCASYIRIGSQPRVKITYEVEA